MDDDDAGDRDKVTESLSFQALHAESMGEVRAIACDYDRTLTTESLELHEGAAQALRGWRASSGGHIVVASGRMLGFLRNHVPWADAIVAENGAVIEWPGTGRKVVAVGGPVGALADAYERLRGHPERGEVIFSCPIREATRLRALADQRRLAVDIVCNADRVMVVPRGVNKGTGVRAALKGLHVAPEDLAAVGDGENDVEMLLAAGVRCAVANAAPVVKEIAQIVTRAGYGDGVVELLEQRLAEIDADGSSQATW